MPVGVTFDFSEMTAVVTGGAGVLCAPICSALAASGARVAILDINLQAAQQLAVQINQSGGQALALHSDALDRASLQAACDSVVHAWGPVDCLVNGAGGNHPQATTSPDLSFFDLPPEAVSKVFDLNFSSALLTSQVFGGQIAHQQVGAILNISSLNADRPLTRIPAYSAAKAALSNFTRWLAVYMAQEVSPHIRVNALAPGFFLTGQNRYLLLEENGTELSPRGQQILAHTPMGRFGHPQDLTGAALWLLSPAAEFVTGVVLPVDGGFSAYSGV